MSPQLTQTQLEVLRTLVELYEKKRRMVKSREVAKRLRKDEGTVRNIIMWLRGMGLVESRTGPAGGYRPTLKAYEILTGNILTRQYGYGEAFIEDDGRVVRLPVYRLELINLLSAQDVMALAKTSSPAKITAGARVRIVSKPVERIAIEGIVRQVNVDAGEFLVGVEKLVVIPDTPVGDIMKRNLITLAEGMTIRQAARVLTSHGIRGAPVVNREGRPVGFITTTDIARLIAEGVSPEEPVKKYVKHHIFTITESESIIEAMRLMDFHGVGRLLVVNNRGRTVGIVTRTDILRYIVSLQTRRERGESPRSSAVAVR